MIKKIFITIVLVFLGALLVAGGFLWYSYRTGNLQRVVIEKTLENVVSEQIPSNLIQDALGFKQPRTYLVLFLNNTELRPGGGFIGAYAVVKVDKGTPQLVKVEGTELLDNYAPQEALLTPPTVLQKYLKVQRWGFRDSNWSPDFGEAASTSLAFYKLEKGVEARNIDAVIGFTPTVIEEVLKIIGPITVNGETFDSSNFTEKLEYEVEYNYAQKGISFNDRKGILTDLSDVFIRRLAVDVFKEWSRYRALATQLIEQKQVVAYSTKSAEQDFLQQVKLDGAMSTTTGDYLLWVDANLGAWKTDASLDRSISYRFAPLTATSLVATSTMHLNHHGHIDWRTRTYRDYARIFVPVGSKLKNVVGVTDAGRSFKPESIDQGVENGRQWFGAFITVEPGHSVDLSFVYSLAPSVVQQIKNGSYTLFVQKQIGTLAPQLTLSLDFGTPVVAAHPGEATEKHGDKRYDLQMDLSVDRMFEVKL